EQEEHGGGDVVGGPGELEHLQLHHVHDEEVDGEHDGGVEEVEEGLALPGAAGGGRGVPRHDADGGDEDQRDGGGEPGHEQHEVGAVVVGAVDGAVELREDGAAESDEALEEPQHDAAVLGEVLDGGDERAGVGEGLGVGADGDVEAHEPDGRARGAAGDGEVDHEVADEVHGGAAGEDDPGRGDLVDEAWEDADVGAHVLEEAERVKRLLVVPQRRLDGLGVDGEDVGAARGRHDEDRREEHEPPPAHHVLRELRRRHSAAIAGHHGSASSIGLASL
uniref:Uncharacterized protein n=1 Tax=Triticum urartu TaxID=4572 RepID=A0A8R7VD53_TRIUA